MKQCYRGAVWVNQCESYQLSPIHYPMVLATQQPDIKQLKYPSQISTWTWHKWWQRMWNSMLLLKIWKSMWIYPRCVCPRPASPLVRRNVFAFWINLLFYSSYFLIKNSLVSLCHSLTIHVKILNRHIHFYPKVFCKRKMKHCFAFV